MNLTDLTEVLRDHAELDDTAHDARMTGIRARVLATRRRLALTGVVCVVLAVVSAVFLTVPRPVEPANPTRSFPEYQSGTRLVVQEWADLPTSSITVEYTPQSDDFAVFNQCSAELAEQVLVYIVTINGIEHVAGGCEGLGWNFSKEVGNWDRYGIAVGKPLVITMTVGVGRVVGEPSSSAEDVRPPDETATGEFGIGVGEVMPVSEYPFPPRPETLYDIDDLDSSEADIEIRADRNDPDARQEISVVWPGSLELSAALNTPGRLEVFINGKVVYDIDSWGYGRSSGMAILGEKDGLNFSPGQTITITVVPERTTGDWSVQLDEIK